jgi:hypothetical protein
VIDSVKIITQYNFGRCCFNESGFFFQAGLIGCTKIVHR